VTLSQNIPVTKALGGDFGDKKGGKQVSPYTYFRILSAILLLCVTLALDAEN
jgi:hypothetical protein